MALGGIGSTPSLIVGVGAGAAAAAAFEPALEIPKQKAWQDAPNRIVDAATMARLYAQGGVDLKTAQTYAHRDGFNNDQLAALIYLAQTVPGLSQTMLLWRWGKVSEDTFKQALLKGGMRPDWIDRIVTDLRSEPLSGEILAAMIQRGVVPDQGQLPNIHLNTDGKVPHYPQPPIDAYEQAAALGMSKDQLDAYTRIQGLPPGMDLVARMAFRGILDREDFNLAAEQSNRRVEWAPYEFEGYREIPTARDYVDAYIRTWITLEECYAGTARHGMSQADTDLLIKDYGRPMNAHQVFRAQIRGGVYDGPTDHIDPAFLKSLEEANVRPEWYNMEWAYRYTLPSYFVIRPLVQTGAISEERATEIFLQEGWPEDIAKAAPAAFAASSGGTTTSYPKKAEGQLWTTTHSSYLKGEIGKTTATDNLTVLGLTQADQDAVFKMWDQERATYRKQLTPKQVQKAWADQVTNPATGQPWTLQDATNELLDRGYSQADATTFLAE